MISIRGIVRACSLVPKFLQPVFNSTILKPHINSFNCYDSYIGFVNKRNMSQKSILSFFKTTPKKPAELNKEPSLQNDSVASNASEESPVKNEKRLSKRQRLESSDEESAPVSPKTNPEKKKVKRQRIESSGSESDKSAEDMEVVVRKDVGAVKTYSSPRSKKKALVQEESPKSKIKVKEEKTTPEPKEKMSPKTEKKTPSLFQNGVTKKIKEAPSSVKQENLSPKSDKDSKTDADSNTDKDKSKKDSKPFLEKKDNVIVNGAKVAETDYNPAKPKYHPIDDACWTKGQEVPYLALAKTLEAIEETSSRLKIIEILANYLRSVIVLTPEDLLPSIYMCLNQLAPAHHSLELGIAETYLMKAVGQCTGRSLAHTRAAARRCGDLGRAAESARAQQRTMGAAARLSARKVFAAFREVARMTGQASVNKKIAKIQSLYVACRQSEARFLIRSFEGKLRIGLAEQSVLQALALAVATTPPCINGEQILDASKGLSQEEFKSRVDEHALLIKTTYCECPDYERLLPALLQHGVHALPTHCRLEPGTPLKPMLASPTRGVGEIFDRFEGVQFTCEWKYDGERAQIHVPGDEAPDLTKAKIFSRNQEDNTSKYPDVVRRLPALLKESVRSCVLDCEAVAYDVANKQILPFQILSTRKRKDAQESEIKVQVCVFVFDLLLLNGRPLVRRPLLQRRALLREHFREVPGEWQFATSKDCTTTEEVQQFLEESVKGSCEGLMVKMLTGDNARYDIARRSHNWLKLKKDYLEGVGDSIDAVVLGAYWGRGRRAGRYGGFLLACRDSGGDEFQALCRLGTGFSDEDLRRLTDSLSQHVIDGPRNYYRYDPSSAPDVWFAAHAVWELRCADLSLSPAHRAAQGLVAADRGISLRFPRFVREREDKTPEQATTAQQIADMYLAQDQVRNQQTKKVDNDDFY
ncbi:DNA ligase 1 isoform X1 [Amyelois transitella]|uniref:DNA ligase 1 isoform X1 n=1 Tax=Amyelois transitella TaxID=680683 RepID=UPI00298FE13E|nr:DNA ligase 1 isoform X1 [Amyelois transitella]